MINYSREKNPNRNFLFPRKTKMNFRNASIYWACGESLSPPYLGFPERLNQILFSCSFFIRRSLVIDFQQSPTCSSFCAFFATRLPVSPKKEGLNDIVPRLPNSLIYCVPRGRKRDPLFEFIFLLRWLCTFFIWERRGEDREEEISEIEKSETGAAFPEN